MKLCNAILFLTLLVGVVSCSDCDILREQRRVYQQINRCELGETPFFVFRLLKRMSADTLSFEEFVDVLHPFCDKFPSNALACLSQNITVSKNCREIGEIQSMVNRKLVAWYVTNLLCENNATRYLDIAADDGPTCYTNDESYLQCVYQPKYEEIISDPEPHSNHNICEFLNVIDVCSSFNSTCQNQSVRVHLGNAQQQLQRRFGCLEY